MQYEIGRASRIGNRENNQDRFAAFEAEGGVLLALADGMGGKLGGELAAQTLIDVAAAAVAQQSFPIAYPQNFLSKIVDEAHAAVLSAGQRHVPPIEPGTTAVLCLVQQRSVWWAHVGDSRLYLFRNGVPLYRTRDHSYVEHLYQEGQISLDKRQGHPMRNYVTQCLGLRPEPPEVSLSNQTPLQVGDVLLLCSDGLWEPLGDAQMGAVLMEEALDEALNNMAQQAEELAYPNSDNISALALRVVSLEAKRAAPPAAKSTDDEDDRLSAAIEEIERALSKYRDEMND